MAFEGDEELVMEDVREAIRLSIGNVFGQSDSMPYNPDKSTAGVNRSLTSPSESW
jgi:hypothetical protein